jgi:DNA-damage-inducible protein D
METDFQVKQLKGSDNIMSDEEQTVFPPTSPFDTIRHMDEQMGEYWSARELHKILGYTEWRNFNSVVIKRAMKACEENRRGVSDHFVRSYKMVQLGSGSQRKAEDILLSRYAAYLVVMNGDPKMPIVAMGQEYFAEQTRRQELAVVQADAIDALPEDQKRLYKRSELAVQNQQLATTAQRSGVITSTDFSVFQNHGYKGLYTLTEDQIHARKGLQESEHILDWMNSDELIANSFRASQTRQKLEREQIQEKQKANQAHFQVGQIVRKAITEAGGIMPEDMSVPEKSIQQLQREEQKRLKQGLQLSLFDAEEDSSKE